MDPAFRAFFSESGILLFPYLLVYLGSIDSTACSVFGSVLFQALEIQS